MSRSNQLAGLLTADPPSALDTINEINTALGNDASLSTTLTNSIATKAPIASPTFTGTPEIDNGTSSSGNLLITGGDANLASSLKLEHQGGGGRTNVDGTWNISFGSDETSFGSPNLNMGGGLAIWHQDSGGSYDVVRFKDDRSTIFGGNVGIGTDDPRAKAEVYDSSVSGTFNATDLSTWRVLQIRNNIEGGSGTAAGIALGGDGTGDTETAGIVGISDNTTGGVCQLAFITATGNASKERMRIDSNGRVGIGTGSNINSSANLHIASGDSYSPHILLENTVSSAGDAGITFADSVESGGYAYRIGTDDTGNAFVFTYKSGGIDPRHGVDSERMRIDSSGNVLIGTNATHGTSGGAVFHDTTYSRKMLQLSHSDTASSRHLVQFFTTASTTRVGFIACSTTVVTYSTSSDYRLKENVTPLTGAINRINQLKPSRFNFIADPETMVDGFLAHEVSDIVPEAVSGEKDAVDENGDIEPQGIDQSKLVPLLVASVQELSAKVTALENAS